MGVSLGQKDILGAEQTKAQGLIIFLVFEGALGGAEGEKLTRTPLTAQTWGPSTLSPSNK